MVQLIQSSQEVVARQGNDPNASLEWSEAVFAYKEGQYDYAVELFQSIQYDSKELAINIAMIHYRQNEYEPCIEICEKLTGNDRIGLFAAYLQFFCHHDMEKYTLSIVALKELLSTMKKESSIPIKGLSSNWSLSRCEVLFNMAIALFKNKQDKMAGDALNNATKFMTEPRQKVSIGKATIKGLKGAKLFAIPDTLLFNFPVGEDETDTEAPHKQASSDDELTMSRTKSKAKEKDPNAQKKSKKKVDSDEEDDDEDNVPVGQALAAKMKDVPDLSRKPSKSALKKTPSMKKSKKGKKSKKNKTSTPETSDTANDETPIVVPSKPLKESSNPFKKLAQRRPNAQESLQESSSDTQAKTDESSSELLSSGPLSSSTMTCSDPEPESDEDMPLGVMHGDFIQQSVPPIPPHTYEDDNDATPRMRPALPPKTDISNNTFHTFDENDETEEEGDWMEELYDISTADISNDLNVPLESLPIKQSVVTSNPEDKSSNSTSIAKINDLDVDLYYGTEQASPPVPPKHSPLESKPLLLTTAMKKFSGPITGTSDTHLALFQHSNYDAADYMDVALSRDDKPKRRWCVLHDHTFYVLKSEENRHIIDTLDLHNEMDVIPLEGHGKHKYEFALLDLAHQRYFQCSLETNQQMLGWISRLLKRARNRDAPISLIPISKLAADQQQKAKNNPSSTKSSSFPPTGSANSQAPVGNVKIPSRSQSRGAKVSRKVGGNRSNQARIEMFAAKLPSDPSKPFQPTIPQRHNSSRPPAIAKDTSLPSIPDQHFKDGNPHEKDLSTPPFPQRRESRQNQQEVTNEKSNISRSPMTRTEGLAPPVRRTPKMSNITLGDQRFSDALIKPRNVSLPPDQKQGSPDQEIRTDSGHVSPLRQDEKNKLDSAKKLHSKEEFILSDNNLSRNAFAKKKSPSEVQPRKGDPVEETQSSSFVKKLPSKESFLSSKISSDILPSNVHQPRLSPVLKAASTLGDDTSPLVRKLPSKEDVLASKSRNYTSERDGNNASHLPSPPPRHDDSNLHVRQDNFSVKLSHPPPAKNKNKQSSRIEDVEFYEAEDYDYESYYDLDPNENDTEEFAELYSSMDRQDELRYQTPDSAELYTPSDAW